ncbi:MAG: carboxypeptidase-like regulatory domain-containing protein [Prevotella sp.]|nr:carboxypeptidase-like regulatory domain-containing protein [Prevotella sp.]
MSLNKLLRLTAICLLFMFFVAGVFAQPSGYKLHLSVTDASTREAVIMATVELLPTGAATTTDLKGEATLTNVPKGRYTLRLRYVGMETLETAVNVERDMTLSFRMTPTSLALKEVTVTAQQKESGASTASVVGRQAIDHLQATSLADVMQLIPGQVMGNHDLTQQTNLQLRTLVNNNTAAFGSSVIVDGMPMSNNGQLTQGQFSSTAFTGTDLRQVSADDIDNVEIIRGIPSAEYGDLTSGLVVVHSRVGITPLQVKAKINPGLQNYSVGKGFSLGSAGVFNVSGDYAKAWGDPRQKTRSYDRYTVNVGWGIDLSKKWHADTKLRFMRAKDWTGNDPDAIDDGTQSENKTTTVGLTHNGRVRLDMPLARSLKYTVGLSLTQTDNSNTSYVANSTGLLPILTARETGYYDVPWMTTSYLATGITESRPGNVFVKLTDDFFLRKGKTVQSFKLGAEYHYDWNNGRGYYNDNELRPYKPNSNGRPRAFDDIPGLHQLSAFAEDQFTWNMNKVNRLRVGVGLRFTALQPFGDVATTALSPRVNAAFTVTKWLDVRLGIGMNSKTPGLNYLYPDKKYDDNVAANYMPQDGTKQVLNYYTQVYDVKYSSGMKNATTTKVEGGVDIKLPGGRKVNVLAYHDKTPDGFGAVTEYFTYNYNYYTLDAQHNSISNPAGVDSRLVYMTTGMIGNTNTTVNTGVEFDCDLGEVKPLATRFYLSGAWNQTKTWSTDMNAQSVRNALLPAYYQSLGLTPVKVVYPSGEDYTRYRRFLTTLRAVTHIPRLKMVASFTAQAIWHNSNYSFVADKEVIGYITPDLVYHEITPGQETITFPASGAGGSADASVAISELAIKHTDNDPTKNPVTWNLQARLTKELGKVGGLSLYVNNALFYEPYLKGNNVTTLTQRNTGTFQFGAELSLNF